jgi:hypothetical protein
MFSIIKSAFPHVKFESLPAIVIKNANDYIINVPSRSFNSSAVVVLPVKKELVAVVASARAYAPTHPLPTPKKREVYDFIDEDAGERSVPEASTPKKREFGTVPEAGTPKIILKRPAPEPVPEKSRNSGPANENQNHRVREGRSPTNENHRVREGRSPTNENQNYRVREGRSPTNEGFVPDEPTNPLQLLLALNDPDLMLMNAAQWGSYIHKYITDEYVYIGQTKTMPFYRKRKQLMQDLEALERSKGSKLMDFGTILNYLAWRYNMQLLTHVYDSDKKMKIIRAYPEIYLWRRATPIYCVGTEFVSPLKFAHLCDYIETSEYTGVLVEWPQIDGKKTELIAELGGEGAGATPSQLAHLKKDELAGLVGKKRAYDFFGH